MKTELRFWAATTKRDVDLRLRTMKVQWLSVLFLLTNAITSFDAQNDEARISINDGLDWHNSLNSICDDAVMQKPASYKLSPGNDYFYALADSV